MRRHRGLASLALAGAFLLGAVSTATAKPGLSLEVDGGTVIEGGAAVLIHLTVECPRGGFEVLEAHASASQGAASGMGGFGLKCGGKARSYDVRVASFGEPFVAGTAVAGGFVLMLHRDGSTISASTTETITLQ